MLRQLQIGMMICVMLAVTVCGAGQAVKDGTVNAATWAFTTQVKTMNIDLVSRSSLNTSGSGQSLSTVVRIYQLKSSQAFEQLNYTQLQTGDRDVLKADLLATKDVVLRPDASASISEPMNKDAQVVGIVAFFRDAGKESTWKLVVPKAQWKKTDPVKIEVSDNTLTVVDAVSAPVKQSAPLPSVPNPPKPPSTTVTVPVVPAT
jgi:type VI secretion system protein VasD